MPQRQRSPASSRASIVAVRDATPADHAAIREVVQAAYRPYAAKLPPTAFRAYLADLLDIDAHARAGQLLVATVDDRVAGSVVFYPDASAQGLGWPTGWAGGRALAVHPDRRRHGAGTALMAELERRALACGAPAFAFHTSQFMTTAIALYERLGYRRRPAFDLDISARYGIQDSTPWCALAYTRRPAADAA